MSQYRRYSDAPKTIDELKFHGAIGNRRFCNITANEFNTALRANGWREAHNGHVYMRLIERGEQLGIFTPNDFARALRNGFTLRAKNEAFGRVCGRNSWQVIFKGNQFITIVHLS
ncbi:MAG TPA: hypothetical protein VG938_04060 [Verrucomicrobiae bacterium]|jgi:hypothetical protein|nr:hypothetical protein [Verrucomicrobiae bacterium]